MKLNFTENQTLQQLSEFKKKYRKLYLENARKAGGKMFAEVFLSGYVWLKYGKLHSFYDLRAPYEYGLTEDLLGTDADKRLVAYMLKRFASQECRRLINESSGHEDTNPAYDASCDFNVSIHVFPFEDKTLALLKCKNDSLLEVKIPELTDYDDSLAAKTETQSNDDGEEMAARRRAWKSTEYENPVNGAIEMTMLTSSDIAFEDCFEEAKKLFASKGVFLQAAASFIRDEKFDELLYKRIIGEIKYDDPSMVRESAQYVRDNWDEVVQLTEELFRDVNNLLNR